MTISEFSDSLDRLDDMIGVFDSGFGGLTVLKEFLRALPDYDYIYLGDNARAPYGDKSAEEIYRHTEAAVDFLFKRGCELVIIACHTASAKALRKIQQEYLPKNYPDRRVLGVVVPIVEEAVKLSRGHRLGVIGTTATINSGVYKKELEKLRNDLIIFQEACPLLVPLVEAGWLDKPEIRIVLKKCLAPFKTKEIDTLILGCTHYPLMEKDILKIMGGKVKVVNPAEGMAGKLVLYLRKHKDLEKKLSKNGRLIFYTTDDAAKFKELGQKFLGKSIKEVKKAELIYFCHCGLDPQSRVRGRNKFIFYMNKEPKNLIERKELPTPRPNLLDVVVIDGRLAQVRPTLDDIVFLDEIHGVTKIDKAGEVNWDEYDYERVVGTVGDLKRKGEISDDDYMAVHYGPEQETDPYVRNEVKFFGKFTKRK